MKDKSILISMGIILYIIMAGVDRFVYRIPNIVYILVAILGIALMLIGFFNFISITSTSPSLYIRLLVLSIMDHFVIIGLK